jgi:YidC/Oxa1 family membrane protein insertase
VDRVQIIAIAAAVALLALWLFLVPQQAPQSPPPAGAEKAPPVETTDAPAGAAISPEAGEAALVSPGLLRGGKVVVENDAIAVEVTRSGARLGSILLKRFPDRVGRDAGVVDLMTSPERGTLAVFLGDDAMRDAESRDYEIVTQTRDAAELRLELPHAVIQRTIRLDASGYGALLGVRVENRGEELIQPEFRLVWYGVERAIGAPDHFPNFALAASVDGSVQRVPVPGLGQAGFFDAIMGRDPWRGTPYSPPVDWVGVDSQYFLAAAIPEKPDEARAFHGPFGESAGLAVLRYPPFEVPPGRYVERTYRLYLGPKIPAEVAAVDARLVAATDVGWAVFRPLVALFEFMLVWTYKNVYANYGIAIILLTILLRVVTFPLTQRSMKSMQKLQVIGPEMKVLQEKYKEDRERLNQEMMALWKRTGINPAAAMGGGCVPMLIQFPFLIALYFALQASIELRHAPFFGWIQDLSVPETLFEVAGVPIRLLPLLMGATMIVQQRMTPTPSADAQQRQMMMWMSVLFIFLFYQFASGLVLYWFVSNLLGIAQQLLVNFSAPQPATSVGSRRERRA